MKTIVLVVVTACFGVGSGKVPTTPPHRAGNDARVTGARSDRKDDSRTIALRSRVTVTVDYLKTLHDEALAKKKNVIIFLNGVGISGSPPEAINLETKEIRFRLERTPDSKKAWASLLTGNPLSRSRTVSVSVGLEGDLPVPSAVDGTNGMALIIIHGWAFVVWGVVFVVLLILLFWFGHSSNMLRDRGKIQEGRLAFSLARTQMAFWFVLVVMAFTYIWSVTGALDTITESTLALIGIAGGTAVTAALVDAGKRTSAANEKTRLEAEKKVLPSRVAAMQADMTAATDATKKLALSVEMQSASTRLEEITQKLEEVKPQCLAASTEGCFLIDILSDANGISFHRFQMAVWTAILGFIFLRSVLQEHAMPEFSATLLGLMGISSGTYLGFKFPEKQS